MFIFSHLILQKIVNDITFISIEYNYKKFYLHSVVLNICNLSSTFVLILLLLHFLFCVFANPGYVPLKLVRTNSNQNNFKGKSGRFVDKQGAQ